MIIRNVTIVFFSLIFSQTLGAKCLNQEYESPCRYPAGDEWCQQHGKGALFAYKDIVFSSINPTLDEL